MVSFRSKMESYRSEREKKTYILKKLQKWSDRSSYLGKKADEDFSDKIMGSEFVEKLFRSGHHLIIIVILEFLNAFDLAFLDVASNCPILNTYLPISSKRARRIFWTNTPWNFFAGTYKSSLNCLLNLDRLAELEDGGKLQEEIDLLQGSQTVNTRKEDWISEATCIDHDYQIKTANLNPVFPLVAFLYNTGVLDVLAYSGRAREKIGPKLYTYLQHTEISHRAISWSPDGLHLLLVETFQTDRLTIRSVKLKLFR